MLCAGPPLPSRQKFCATHKHTHTRHTWLTILAHAHWRNIHQHTRHYLFVQHICKFVFIVLFVFLASSRADGILYGVDNSPRPTPNHGITPFHNKSQSAAHKAITHSRLHRHALIRYFSRHTWRVMVLLVVWYGSSSFQNIWGKRCD